MRKQRSLTGTSGGLSRAPSSRDRPREDGRRGIREIHDGGDQGDDLVLPVALTIGDLVLDDAHVPGVPRVQVPSGAGGFQERGPALPLTLGFTSTDR